MDRPSRNLLKLILHKFKSERDKCPEYGCTGDHFCAGKPTPEKEKSGYFEIEAQIKDEGLEAWRNRLGESNDDFNRSS